MTELLKQYGFHYVGKCPCGGFATAKYRVGNYELHWRTAKYQFKLKFHGISLTGWTPLENAKDVLEKQIEAQAVFAR